MTEHESSVALRLWTLIVRFLVHQRGFQVSVAEDVAGEMIAGMIERHSTFFQGGYPSRLAHCLCQEAVSRADAAKKRSQRSKSLDFLDMDVRQRLVDRSSQSERTPRQEAQLNCLKRFLSEARIKDLTEACGTAKPRQSELAKSIGMNPKKWKALRNKLRALSG